MSERPTPPGPLPAEDDAVIGRAFRWSAGVVLILAGILVAVVWLVNRSDDAPPPSPPEIVPATVPQIAGHPPAVFFRDVTNEAGINFVHENGAAGEKLLPETMGGGCVFFDYDNDDDQDLLLVNGNHWPGGGTPDEDPPTMMLYRNDGSGQFQDVSAEAGLDVSFYGMGATAGDYDGDGDQDLFITAVGRNHLFRNDDGRFVDVSAEAGVEGTAADWGTSATFLDFDNDGDLDLFVCNYVRWSRDVDLEVNFRLVGVGRAYGPPTDFEGVHPYLYRNEGDGTFTDVSAPAGVRIANPATSLAMAKALGVLAIDVDGDRFPDLIVANDTVQNFFFRNQRDGTFVEDATMFGLAFDRNGVATGAMGIDGGYFRNGRNLAFFMGNFANEMTSLYVAQDDPTLFADQAITDGIGAVTRRMLTFGLFLFDYDLDGRLDLLQANGHIEEEINVVQASQHYEQPAQLFWNAGPDAPATFVPVAPDTVGDLARPIVGRGAAYADIDDDGDLDVLLTQTGRAPLLLRNEQALGHRALRVRLVGTTSNLDALGAWVTALAGGISQRRAVMPSRSYLSQVETPITFGLGPHSEADVTVEWPSGAREALGSLAAGATYVVTEGQGVTARRPFSRP